MTTLSLMMTTDIHGYLDNGLSSLSSTKSHLSPDLLIDNGDFFVGSPYASYGYATDQLSPLVHLANTLGFDVMVPGNHDLDFGLDWLKRQVAAINADYLCANLFDRDHKAVFKPYAIRHVKGLRIGIVGLMTEGFSQLSPKSTTLETIVTSPITALTDLLPILEPQIDFLIVSYHGGLTRDPLTSQIWSYPSVEDQAYELNQAFPQIHSLICGHQHFENAITTPTTALIQPGSHGRVVGYQEFDVGQDNNFSIITNQLIHQPAQHWTVEDEAIFELWLDTPVNQSTIMDYLMASYPADLHLLNSTSTRLDELWADTQGPFPLGYYYLPGSELAVILDVQDTEIIDEHRPYVVIASPGILPTYYLRQPLMINLFDELLRNKAY